MGEKRSYIFHDFSVTRDSCLTHNSWLICTCALLWVLWYNSMNLTRLFNLVPRAFPIGLFHNISKSPGNEVGWRLLNLTFKNRPFCFTWSNIFMFCRDQILSVSSAVWFGIRIKHDFKKHFKCPLSDLLKVNQSKLTWCDCFQTRQNTT